MPLSGDPYDTDTLEAQRSRQRRWLAEIPRHVLPQIARPDPEPAGDAARQTESWLRELADSQIEALDEGAVRALDAMVAVEKMAVLRRLSQGVRVEAPGSTGPGPSEFSRFVAEVQDRAEQSLQVYRETNPGVDARPYQAAIVLLVLADLHAGDGVVDGRFASLAAGRV
ncbi:MAG TPA: hypothetical protein VGO60_03055 [Iamia sp.]|jgi:hypothetical protein|nr:hypothetical protein [Iamia sp.]